MQNKDILISGASIAGPALAFWLHEFGFRPTVVEHAPSPRSGGQTVDLRGAGRVVVARMGLLDQVRRLSLDQRGIAFVAADGRIAARVPTELFGGEGIVSDLEVLRGDLGRVLYEATAPHAEYVFDDTITGLDQDGHGVHVRFETAAPRRFDLVIGADGLHSCVRALAFGPEQDCVRPLGCYTSWFTAPAEIDLDGWYLMYNAPGGLVASMRPGRLPGEIKAGLSFRSGPLSYDRRDLAAQHDLLAERFAGAGWHVPMLLQAGREASDFFFDSMGQVHLDRWARGRAALIGDAGYCPTPLTGLGTSLALVGAYVLAGELAKADGDHTIGYHRYEQIMRRYVTRAQQLPPGGVRGYAPTSALGITARTASMRWMGRWPVRNLLARQFGKAEDIALPQYGPDRETTDGPAASAAPRATAKGATPTGQLP